MEARRPVLPEGGFTMVEVLLVVFIVGLATGLIVMSLPEGDGPLDRDARRVASALDGISDRAVMTGMVHAIKVRSDGFDVAQRIGGNWTPVRQLGQDLSTTVSAAFEPPTRPRTRSRTQTRAQREAKPDYDIHFDPTGRPVDGTIVLTNRRDARRIPLNGTGEAVQP